MCGASVEGDKIGSTNLYFTPHHVSGGEYVSEVGTAGSVCLVLQVALPAALFADDTTNLRIIGGTNCEMAPQIDFMTEVFKPNLEDFGCTFDFNLFRRGYFPKGGGKIVVNVPPISFLNSIEKLDQGNVASICGWAYVAGKVPIRAAHDMAKAAIDVLRREYPNVAINIERYQEAPAMAEGNGSGIMYDYFRFLVSWNNFCFVFRLVCKTTTGCVLGGSAIGNNRKCSASESGRLAALELLEDLQSGACVDRYVQDMIIVLIALSKGKSRIRVGEITLHTKSAMYVAESITQVPFNIIEDGTTNIIEIEGIGLSNVN